MVRWFKSLVISGFCLFLGLCPGCAFLEKDEDPMAAYWRNATNYTDVTKCAFAADGANVPVIVPLYGCPTMADLQQSGLRPRGLMHGE